MASMLILGDYQFDVSREIGRGAFGSVFKGENVKTLATVAGKRITVEKDYVKEFEKEEKFLLELPQHENVVKILKSERREYKEKGTQYVELWVITEYYPLSLKEYVNQKDLSFEAKIDLMVQCCKGLHHLHHHGAVHRDVKPENMMIDEKEGKAIVKIIDFGESRWVQRIEGKTIAMKTFAGTQAYMAPEMLRREGDAIKPNYTTSVDVFAMGVTFLSLMTSQPGITITPYKGK